MLKRSGFCSYSVYRKGFRNARGWRAWVCLRLRLKKEGWPGARPASGEGHSLRDHVGLPEAGGRAPGEVWPILCAIYVRLGKENEDKRQPESESIQNQKTLLTGYAIDHGWEIYSIYSTATRTTPAQTASAQTSTG